MKSFGFTIVVFCGLALLFRCSNSSQDHSLKRVSTNQLTKVELGKLLFFDTDLSLDHSISCASCHNPEDAFTDNKTRSKGIKGRTALRNAPNLFHLKEAPYFLMDGAVPTLEQQIIVPIQDPNEMGASMKLVISRLKSKRLYRDAAKELFNRSMDAYVLTRSIAAYLRTIKPSATKFDKFWKGDSTSFDQDEKLGYLLFTGRLNCTTCHKLPFFTNYSIENNGATSVQLKDLGRFRIDGIEKNKGKFKVPNLRGLSKTAPYMHDGSIKNLEDVVEIYSRGGRGSVNQSTEIKSFRLSKKEKLALVRFLKTL